ncbi:UNVERIFIED_CONTAM: hypothetical protein PYX00_004173 [Menopon gallinae]|uniref:PH domain-containing protein n=1 Tax=Menopon gallinae TaxID=328185 RepID=A0AAW2I363_9NEOP
MDPFTQTMMEKTRLRREKLNEYLSRDFGVRQPLSEKNGSTDFCHREITKNDVSKPALQKGSTSDSENMESNTLVKPSVDSEPVKEPFGCTENNFQKSRSCKLGRLAELATKIKEWEDELDKPKQCPSASKVAKVSNKKSVTKTEDKSCPTPRAAEDEKKTEKQVIWDTAVIKSLESQGFALSRNESRLTYDFEEKERKVVKPSEPPKTKFPASPSKRLDSDVSGKEVLAKRNSPRLKTENKDSIVLKKANFFESQQRLASPIKVEKDPTELSISERKALFEKNAGEAPMPKVAFATPLPAKLAGVSSNKTDSDRSASKVKTGIAFEKNLATKPATPIHKAGSEPSAKRILMAEEPEKENKVKIQKEMFEKGLGAKNESEPPRNVDIAARERELEYLKKRWDHNKNFSERETPKIPDPPPMPPTLITSSPARTSAVSTPVKNNNNDSGRLYPSLSEFEESDSDKPGTEDDSINKSRNSDLYLNMSFSDILAAKKDDPPSSKENSFTSEMRESQVLSKIDEFLDNALDELSSTTEYEGDDECAPSPPKISKSTSFEYRGPSEESNALVHTVSFYRKQQQSSLNNPTANSFKSIRREENVVEDIPVEEEGVLVENKIQELLQEINKQQTIISQASQALNLCLSTVEFSNSGEQVESERLLLLANHKRQACLNEIQRLKVENSIRPRGSNQQLTEKGDIIITNIAIPLKRDALLSMAAVESMQYLVCLIKSDERVIATPAVPATRDNLKNMVLCFPGQYKLEKLLSDFKVTVEVYNLELSKEMLPHEVKYHIVSKKDKKLLTPIKSKKTESKLVMPYVQSPAGPNAVRTSNFHLCGYVVFSLREVSRTNWTLNKVPYTSPLEGSFSMKIQSQLQLDTEFRGFLTMFDDISGFGAWHRRWCLLSSHTLSYWKYPDDETRKIPIGSIDLRGVVTENVGLVSRDICARLHTFLLETTRPRQPEDKDSLVLSVQGDITRIRHLLSADSKEEMLVWCRKLNTSLALLRSWRCTFDS